MTPKRKRGAGLFSQQFGDTMRNSAKDLEAVQASLNEPVNTEAPLWLAKILRRDAGKNQITRYKLDHLLVSGRWYGALEVVPSGVATCVFRMRRVQAYRVRCRCGEETWMPARMIVERWATGVGCGGSDCLYSKSVVSWTDPIKAVMFQLQRLAAFNGGEELVNEWGGSAYEGLETADLDTTAACIVSSFSQEQKDQHRWWMCRKVKWMPYGPDNVEWLAGIEDPFLLGIVSNAAIGQATAEDLAQALRVDIEKVRRLMACGLSEDDLVDTLLEAQG